MVCVFNRDNRCHELNIFFVFYETSLLIVDNTDEYILLCDLILATIYNCFIRHSFVKSKSRMIDIIKPSKFSVWGGIILFLIKIVLL